MDTNKIRIFGSMSLAQPVVLHPTVQLFCPTNCAIDTLPSRTSICIMVAHPGLYNKTLTSVSVSQLCWIHSLPTSASLAIAGRCEFVFHRLIKKNMNSQLISRNHIQVRDEKCVPKLQEIKIDFLNLSERGIYP